MDPEIKEEFADVRSDLRSLGDRVRDVETHLTKEIRRLETTLREEIRVEGVATRRHIDVVAESLRDDIRIIAEGFVALDAKVERIRDSR